MFKWFKKYIGRISIRKKIRNISTFILFSFVIVFSTVYRLNIEEYASSIGADDIIKFIFEKIHNMTLPSFLIAIMWIMTGSVGTMWVDHFLRKKSNKLSEIERKKQLLLMPQERKATKIFISEDGKISNTRYIADISATIRSGVLPTHNDADNFTDMNEMLLGQLSGNVHDGKVVDITIDLAEPFLNPAILVIGERNGAKWKVTSIGQSHVKLSVGYNSINYAFVIEIAENATENELVPVNTIIDPIRPRVEDAPIQLRSSIEEKTPQKTPRD